MFGKEEDIEENLQHNLHSLEARSTQGSTTREPDFPPTIGIPGGWVSMFVGNYLKKPYTLLETT